MQGSPDRAKELASFLAREFNTLFDGARRSVFPCFVPFCLMNCRYKVKNVICVSHGMGMPSLSILLHELFKLLQYAGCLEKCTLIRSGTCGGVGSNPGTVAITTEGCDTELNHYYSQSYIGKVRSEIVPGDQ